MFIIKERPKVLHYQKIPNHYYLIFMLEEVKVVKSVVELMLIDFIKVQNQIYQLYFAFKFIMMIKYFILLIIFIKVVIILILMLEHPIFRLVLQVFE